MANKPVHEVRIGPICASVWANGSDGGRPQFNVTIKRWYKKDDEWKTADGFRRDDLLAVAKAADLAHTWICQQRKRKKKPEPEGEDDYGYED